jgi:hypothetical protein
LPCSFFSCRSTNASFRSSLNSHPSSLVSRSHPCVSFSIVPRLSSLMSCPSSFVLPRLSTLFGYSSSHVLRLSAFVSRHLFLDSQTLFPLVSSLDPHKSSSSLVACPLYRSSLYLVSPPSILINRLSFLVSYLSSLVPLFYRPLSLVPPLSSFVLRLSSLVSILFSIVPRTMS